MRNSYLIGNWKQYNKSLINRGSITFWFSEKSIKTWKAKKNKNHFGRPLVYSDLAIETSSMIRFIYHLPLRSTQGFLLSLASILKLKIPIPSYTQICRRAQKLQLNIKLSNKRVTDIVFDSSGLKVYGDKGYDSNRCFEVIDAIGAEHIIPTRINSNVFREMHYKRSEILMEIRGLGDDKLARSIWKKLKGYHRRSLVETAFYRIKTLLGGKS
ncbi:MAG: hypothetical protein K1060chlam5_00994 [Candidatus Anoxychlamydiales bacterium]|nr:hypothetical protein [Candidatus Anoxychlamydiales bacterium]